MTNVATRETPLSMQVFRGFESTLPKRNLVSRREALCQYFETHRKEFGRLPVAAAAAIAGVFTHSGLHSEAQEIVERARPVSLERHACAGLSDLGVIEAHVARSNPTRRN